MSGGEWELGQTSKQYETGGRGANTVSSGIDDPGGVSYGSYQMTSQSKAQDGTVVIGGTVAAFLKSTKYGEEFKGLTPGSADFSAKWKEVAKTDPSFAEEQHDYIKRTHYDKLVDRLKDKGLDLSDRGHAVQDAMWSTAVQYGPGSDKKPGGSGVFLKAMEDRFGKGYDLEKISDKKIIEAVQDYKADHVKELFPRVKKQKTLDSLENRAENEKADLLKLVDQEKSIKRESSIDPTQGNPNKSAHAVAETLDPRDRAIYDRIRSGAPQNVQDDAVLQATADLKQAGLTSAQSIDKIALHNGALFITSDHTAGYAHSKTMVDGQQQVPARAAQQIEQVNQQQQQNQAFQQQQQQSQTMSMGLG
ncbi:peptidoglycan-binding domain-containing protein [Solilutibacter silvestris]|uniref:VgrG-related protein n=1 Tax=Solilutibacter silvestris TaxID=1645665 RepID=UPI003D35755C